MKETSGLFKYLSPDKLVFFENCLVLLTPPNYLNDPWDFRPKGRGPSEDQIQEVLQEVEKHIALPSVIDLPAHFVQRERQVLLERIRARLTSNEFVAGHGEYYQKEIGTIIGIVSLTELPLSRLMWAHYAQSHEGFVAEFAAGEEADCEGFIIRGTGIGLPAVKVKYTPSFHQPSKDADKDWEVCSMKHPDWATEKEWRIIWELRESMFCRVSCARGCEPVERSCLPFAPEGLRSVIFGMRIQPTIKQRLRNMLDQEAFKHVRKLTTDIDPETGELVLKPLESCQ